MDAGLPEITWTADEVLRGLAGRARSYYGGRAGAAGLRRRPHTLASCKETAATDGMRKTLSHFAIAAAVSLEVLDASASCRTATRYGCFRGKTGVELSFMLPSPSCPMLLAPQQYGRSA
jgi:hypothetical protein